MVPSRRLLWIAALVLWPTLGIIGWWPAMAGPCWLIVLAVSVLAVGDAVTGRAQMATLAVAPPTPLSGVKGRLWATPLDLSGWARPGRVGVAWPAAFDPPRPVLVQPRPDGSAQIVIEARAVARGVFQLEALWAEQPSPLRLWDCRRSLPMPLEIRIHPDLRADRRGLAALFLLRRGHAAHRRSQMGKGREFDHLRDYVPGDDMGDIHWKSTARRSHPVTKTFQLERTREVYAFIDHSRLSARSHDPHDPQAESHLDRCLQAALILGLAAQHHRDHFGLGAFASQITRFLRAGQSPAHFQACRNQLIALQPTLEAPDFDELFIFLRRSLHRRSWLVFLTDLSDPVQAESFVHGLRLLSRHHVCLVLMIQSPEVAPLFSRPLSPEAPLAQHLAGHYQWNDLNEVGRALRQVGAHFSLLPAADLGAHMVAEYVSVKQRQLL
jgi:uncharacterized protein (DUF58 family)